MTMADTTEACCSTPGKPVRDGFHHFEFCKTTWEVPVRYQELCPIGIGAYGTVCSALDTLHGMRVAMKKLCNPFSNNVPAKRAYRELRVLKHMKNDNIIGLLDVFTPSAQLDDFRDIYLVFHLMKTDLAQLLKLQQVTGERTITDEHTKFLIYQILRGLKYVHSAGIIHRDLKPSNVAVGENCELRLLDFGLARATNQEMTGYVVTRHWRAPEVILNWRHYDQKVDLWSVGCIMVELFTGRTLFTGDDYADQLSKIFQVVGTPCEEFIQQIPSAPTQQFIHSLPIHIKKSFALQFDISDPLAVDLLDRLLVIDPSQRISAEEALAHPYLSHYSDPEDEPTAPPYDEGFEQLELDTETWRKLIWDEIHSFVPDLSLYHQL